MKQLDTNLKTVASQHLAKEVEAELNCPDPSGEDVRKILTGTYTVSCPVCSNIVRKTKCVGQDRTATEECETCKSQKE